MATAGGGRAPNESGGAGEEFCKRRFLTEIDEEPQNVSQEAGRNNSTGASELRTHQGGNSASIAATLGKSELEQMLKQMTFTRSESQCLIAVLHSRIITVLHSRIITESPSERDGAKPSTSSPPSLLTVEASATSGSLKKHKLGDEKDNIHIAVVSSRVLEEEIASPAELPKAHTIDTGQAPSQYLKLIKYSATCLPRTHMASPQHPTTMENLPDELLLNIFIRLLAKQLAQMRCVSKSWIALLSQSSFIKSHLDRSIYNKDQILLVFYYKDASDSKPFTTHSCQSPNLALTNFIKLPVNPQSEYNRIEVIGSVNGLICSSYSDSVIQIWNPSLSAVSTLPPYAMPSLGYNSAVIYFRFGFDPKNDDYKVVKLTGLVGPSTNAVKWWLQVEIYSMRKGSWEIITPRVPSHITKVIDADFICVDGHDGSFHWLGFIGEKMDSVTIVAFDLGSESFREMSLPIQTVDLDMDCIGVLGRKLCVMSWCGDDGAWEVWVMDEYGVAESWVKRHVFSQFNNIPCSFGFTSHNEFLVEVGGCQLLLYDPITDKAKSFENYCDDGTTKIVEYVDSLVWVTPAEHA